MATRDMTNLANRAGFIFTGTVERTAAATLADAPIDAATAVVHVEKIFRAPEVLGDQTGRSITVQLRKADAKKGTRALFFANGWLYGESIAVTEVDRMSVDDPEDMDRQVDRAYSLADERELAERIDNASLVVVARVGKIVPVRRRAGRRDSEHSPEWFVADLEIESVEKGRRARDKPVPLAFPTSDDIQWYWRPRPQPGQEAVWILRREEELPGLPKDVFTALDPRDVRPRDQIEHVRRLIAGPK
jgi:hypothetical protein